MSSKILRPERAPRIRPLAWRQVHEAAADAGPGPEAPDPARLLAQVRSEYEQKVVEAHTAGVRAGEARAQAAAAAELQAALDRIARSVAELARLRARLRRDAEADLVKLALAVARRILHRELAIDPEAMHGLIRAALEKLAAQEICRVFVHPDHAVHLRDCLERIGGQPAAEVIADGARERGTLVFETVRGNLDVSVETQLAEIERGLADRLRRSG